MSQRYVPGVCNIGDAEIKHRRTTSGWGGVVLCFAVLGILAFLNVSFFGYLLLIFPIYLATLGFLQAREHFCVAYGRLGVSNISGDVGETRDVIGAANRKKDALKAKKISLKSLKISAIVTIIVAIISSLV